MYSAFGVEDSRLGIAKAAPGWAAPTAAIAGSAAVGAGLNEILRRRYNKNGAGITPSEQYLHPYRSQRKAAVVGNAHWANKRRTKADAMPDSTKKDRILRRANRNAYVAQFHRAAADAAPIPGAGTVRGFKQVGRYDRNRHYETS